MLIFDIEKHPTESFLDEFTSLRVQYAVDDFVNGLRARATDKPSIDTWSISQVVTNTLASLKTAPSEPSTAKLVQDVWSSLNGLLRYSEISAVELRYTRSIIMVSEWSLLNWLQNVICQSYQNHSSSGNWLERLIHDIHRYHSSNHKRTGEIIQFSSTNYFTSQEIDSAIFNFRIPGYRVEKGECRTLTTAAECLKSWLKFPSSATGNLRFRALDTILAIIPKSILLIEPMWRLYSNPVGILMGARRTARLTEIEFDKVVGTLESCLLTSGLLDPASPIRLSLDVLSDLNAYWVNSSQQKSIRVQQPTLSPSLIPSPNPLSTPEDMAIKCKVFLTYLQILLPIVQNGSTQYLNSKDKIVSQVANKLDHLLPFRECAPTRLKARSTVYNGLSDGITPERFWSILMHQGVFFLAHHSLVNMVAILLV